MATTFQWRLCDSLGANCVDIAGATSPTYQVPAGFNGSLRVVADGVTSAAWNAVSTIFGSALPLWYTSGTRTRMPESSGGHTYYIANSGSDSTGAGSFANPWRGLSKALTACVDGDIINCRGTADYTAAQTLTSFRFSPENPVTIQSYTGEQARFTGASAAQTISAFTMTDLQGIRFRNITSRPTANNGGKIANSQDLEFDGFTHRDSGTAGPGYPTLASGLLVQGASTITPYTFPYSQHIAFWNCYFANNGGPTLGQGGSANHDHSLYLGDAGSVQNTSPKHGLDGFIIANSLFWDHPQGITVQIGGSGYNGFIVNNTFYNILTDPNYGGQQISLWAPTDNYFPTQNNVIANNIFQKQTSRAVSCSLGRNVSNFVNNNLGYQSGVPPDFRPTYGSFTGFTQSGNITGQDPKFKAPTGTFGSLTNRDFSLQAGSPAIGVGDPTFTPPTDITGTPRTQATLGCYA